MRFGDSLMSVDEFIKLLGGLGLGASAGAVVTALITTYSNKGKSRAEAADLLVSAAERVGRINAELDDEMRMIRSIVFDMQNLLIEFSSEEMTREEFIHRANKMCNHAAGHVSWESE